MCFQMCLQIARPRDFSSVFSNCFSKGMQIHIGCTFARLNYLRCSSLSLGPLHWSCSNLNHVVQDFDSSSCAANKKCCLLHESRFKLRKYLDCKFVFGLAKTLESETQQKSSIAFYATGSTLHEYLKKKNLFQCKGGESTQKLHGIPPNMCCVMYFQAESKKMKCGC